MASFTLSSSLCSQMGALSMGKNLSSTDRLKASRAPCSKSVDTTTEARVVIRFTRMGRKHAPFYRIVAIPHWRARDGLPCAYLGWHNPMKDETNLNAAAIKEWIDKGAKPSPVVEKLLRKAMIVNDSYPAPQKKKKDVRKKKVQTPEELKAAFAQRKARRDGVVAREKAVERKAKEEAEAAAAEAVEA